MKKYLLITALMMWVSFPMVAQTVLFQSGFEPADATFLYRAGSTNTPVQATTGGNLGPYCGKFNTNGKYQGAFATGTTINLTAGKFYTIRYSYKVATCAGSLSIYRSNTAATYANITGGTLLSTITTNQTLYSAQSVTFMAPATVSQFIGFATTMTANGCNSANFWLDDVSVTEYDNPPCDLYCVTGTTTAITSYISGMSFSGITRPSGWDGYICTGLQTSVERTVSYNLALSYHNQTTSQKFVAAWIDYNRDGDFADAGEQVLANTDITSATAPVDATVNQNVTIPVTAALGVTKMRVALVIGTSAQTIPCSPNAVLSDFEDYDIEVLPTPTPMAYVSSTVTQNNTTPVNAGTVRNEVIGIQVVTSGTLTPLSATSFTFTTTGTTNSAADISNAQLWYTTNSSTFATTTQVGSTFANPNGTFTIVGSATLMAGTNYFWLTYDIPVTATTPDVIDATCTSITIGGTPRVPSVTNPAGNRPIVTALPMVYLSSTTTQNVSRTPRPDVNRQIIGVEIVTDGAASPLSATSFSFNTTGTSAIVTNNIQNARLWSTGNSPVFATGTQVGATIPAPNGAYTITPAVTLLNGTNYFWLTYDIPASAGCDPVQADAQCTSITIGGVPRVPTVTAPLGAVVIDCLTAYYSKGSLPANLPGSWNTKRDGTGSDATSFGVGSMFYVQNGHIMNTSAAVTIPYMTIETGGRVNASFLITMTDLRINGYGTFEQIYTATNGTYITNFYIENFGTWIHNNPGFLPSVNRYFSPRSNQWFYQWGGGTFPSGTAWGNVLLNGTTTGNFGMGYVLTTIQGDFEWRRIGSGNYLMDEATETINIGGNLIFSGGWWKIARDFSVAGNQAVNVAINVAGDFIMTSGTLEDYGRGASSSGAIMNVNGDVTITGGTINFNVSPGGASQWNLTVGDPAMNWSQTGGAVTLSTTVVKAGKTAYMTGTKLGDVAASRTLTVETGAKLYTSNYPVTGGGNFTLQTGSHLGIGSAAGITSSGATGNVQVSGTRSYHSGATYEYYEGLTPQATGNFTTTTTSGTYPSQVANLIINKDQPTDQVTLTNTTDVTGTLTLTNGVLYTSLVAATAPWIRIPSAATVSPVGGSALSYVDGYIRRQGSSAFVFPTGNSGKWRRIAITAPSIATEFESRYVNTPFTNTTTMAALPTIVLDHVSKVEHWYLNKPLGNDAATTKVRLHWEDASQSIIYKFDSLSVGRWSGSAWENSNCYGTCPANWTSSTTERTYTGSASGSGAGTIQSNTTNNFGVFTFSSVGIWSLNPLPVSLLGFEGQCNDTEVLLKWSTASETNNSYFSVERSSDGKNFKEVGQVAGAGTSSTMKTYRFTDLHPSGGINYYRLSQTDFDGTREYFRMIAVSCKQGPDPVFNAWSSDQGWITLSVASIADLEIDIQVVDITGRTVQKAKLRAESGYSEHPLNVSSLSSGTYFVNVSGQGKVSTHKVLIQ